MKIAFIGGGKMVASMVQGLNNSGMTSADLAMWMRNEDKQQQFTATYNIKSIQLSELKAYDAVIIGVIPSAFSKVAHQLKKYLTETQILVSIAGGISIEAIDDMFDDHPKIIRVMPNTPVAVNAGILAMSRNEFVTKKEAKAFSHVMAALGHVEWMDEQLMHVVPAVAASSPVFIYMMIEAMADNAVAEGIDRAVAYNLASRMVIGAGKMVLESGKHPAELKDQVTSPGGSTIQGVMKLEEKGFRDAVSKAMDAITHQN